MPGALRPLLVVAAVVFTTACNQSRATEPAQTAAAAVAAPAAEDEAGAHKAHEAYVTAINSNQLDAFLGTVSDDIASTDTPRPDGPAKGTPVVTDTGHGVHVYRRGSDGVWHVARDVRATDHARP